MTRRVPKNQSARTVTSRLMAAIAADFDNFPKHLRTLSEMMRDATTQDEAARVSALFDAALDDLARVPGFVAAWPRAQKEVLHRAPNMKVVGTHIAKVTAVIIVCNEVRQAWNVVESDCHRPKDRRIIPVTNWNDVHRTRGLSREGTVWTRLKRCTYLSERYAPVWGELRARFDQPIEFPTEAISMLDWSVVHHLHSQD